LPFFTIEHEQVLRTDLNNSDIRYTKKYVFSWQGVCTHPAHLVCLRHWTELNVLLYDGTRALTGLLLLCVWLRLTTLGKRIWWWWWWWWKTLFICELSL